MEQNLDTSVDVGDKADSEKKNQKMATISPKTTAKTQVGSGSDPQKTSSLFSQDSAESQNSSAKSSSQDGLGVSSAEAVASGSASGTSATGTKDFRDPLDQQRRAQSAQAQASGFQLDQFGSFVKANWKVIIGEFAAAAVASYLQHAKDQKAKSSSVHSGPEGDNLGPDLSPPQHH